MAVDRVGGRRLMEGLHGTNSKQTEPGRSADVEAKMKGGRKKQSKSTVITKKRKPKYPRLPRPRSRDSLPAKPMAKYTAMSKPQSAAVESSDLQQVLHLLSRLFHRNRNQHRAQHWWKFLALLRRAIRRLREVERDLQHLVFDRSDGHAAVTAEAVRRWSEKEKELQERKAEVEGWVRETLLPRCYVSFSGLVADGSFCALGLVLLGVLGGVGNLVGLPREEFEVDRFVGRRVRETSSERSVMEERGYFGAVEGAEDIGQVVLRQYTSKGKQDEVGVEETGNPSAVSDERAREKRNGKDTIWGRASKASDDLIARLPPEPSPRSPDQTHSPGPPTLPINTSTKPSKTTGTTLTAPKSSALAPALELRKKKKRKKGNAIDDLFGTLI